MFKYRQSSGSNPPAEILSRRHTTSAVSSSNKINLPCPQALYPQKKSSMFIRLVQQEKVDCSSREFWTSKGHSTGTGTGTR